MRGRFIVIYGINNIGKSTQARMLITTLRERGVSAEYIKYPVYDLAPTGPRLNSILREGKEAGISEIDLQTIYTQNRKDFEPELHRMLDSGAWVIAEDYTGTGIAWGWAKGAPLKELTSINKGLLKEDVAILLDGERFMHAKEHNHIHEQQDTLTMLCRRHHLTLAGRYGWHIVHANLPPHEIHEKIWNAIREG